VKCEKCGSEYPSVYYFKADAICTKCFEHLSPADRDRAIEESLKKHRMTSTTFELEGFRVTKQLGVVRGITVRSRSVFGTLGATLQTLVGGNITLFTELCEKSRAEAFEMMVSHAERIGANAVIGVRYDTTEMMDGVTEVLCYGTAVVVEPVSEA
jgi:uncharacterized protein YbjQ (UPF0145 family)